MSSGKPEVIEKASAKVESPKDGKDFDNIVRKKLKDYIEKTLGPKIISVTDSLGKRPASTVQSASLSPYAKDIIDSNLASVVTAYISMRSQEQQAKTNLKLQILILITAIASLVLAITIALKP